MPSFNSGQAVLNYHRFGSGKEVLLAFHGFGMTGKQFEILAPSLADRFTVYSFDLFFHGETTLVNTTVNRVRNGLDSQQYAEQISSFLDSIDAQTTSIISYSMGALMALSLIRHIPERIRTVIFIAPDGIRPNPLLRLGSRNWLVNRIFYKLVYSPATVSFLLNQMLRFKYIDEALFRILSGEFKSEETRLTCYNAITYHGTLCFDLDELSNNINKHAMCTYFYFGKYDKLFPPHIGRQFSAKLADHKLTVIDAGHELVNESLNDLLSEHLKENDSR